MRYLIILLCFAGISCSKKDDKTFFTITNNAGFDFKNVLVGYQETGASGNYRLVQNIGELAKNQTSSQYELTIEQVTEVYLYFDAFNQTYIIKQPYRIKRGELNPVIMKMTDEGTLIAKTDALYPKP